MVSSIGRTDAFTLTERELGEAYLLGTAVVLAGILASTAGGPGGWSGLGLFAVGGLAVVGYWLRSLRFDRRQVWRVAEFGALGTGLGTAFVVGGHLVERTLTVSGTLTALLTAAIAAATLGGALVGVAVESQRLSRRLSVRNAVLHRVLRHNLRNDMTVVLANLDDAKRGVEGPERERIATAERKIQALVDLVDNVREVSVANGPVSHPRRPVDLAALVAARVDHLTHADADVDIETDLSEDAWARAEEQFALVVDHLAESAVIHSDRRPTLRVAVSVERDDVVLRVEDVGCSIPDSDLSALAGKREKPLDHGRGVELWLVYWLTERSDGAIRVETDADVRAIEIRLSRARPTTLRGLRDWLVSV